MFQIVYLGATTNERLNFPRYKHFHTNKPGVYKSPFLWVSSCNLLQTIINESWWVKRQCVCVFAVKVLVFLELSKNSILWNVGM